VQVHAYYPNGGPTEHSIWRENNGWRCVDATGSSDVYSLEGLPPGFLEELDGSDSGNSYLSISSATMIKANGRSRGEVWTADASAIPDASKGKNEIKVSPDATFFVIRGNRPRGRSLQEGRRRLVAPGDPTGDHTLLVVRVTDTIGDAPSKSLIQISRDIFGPAEFDQVNLVSELCIATRRLMILMYSFLFPLSCLLSLKRSRYIACSGERLQFIPATRGNSNSNSIINSTVSINGGVMELNIPQIVRGVSALTVESFVTAELSNLGIGEFTFTHTMLILPASVDVFGAAGYAYLDWYLSVIKDFCELLLCLMYS